VYILNSAIHEEMLMRKCETELKDNSVVIKCQIYLATLFTKKNLKVTCFSNPVTHINSEFLHTYISLLMYLQYKIFVLFVYQYDC
jgi:hypothetical protein